MSFRSKEKWGGSRLQLRHPLRPFLGVCPPCSNQQNPPGALIFPCVCVSGCRALGFGGAVPHYPRTMEESPREGGGEPFCTLPPAQPSTLSILGKLRHGGVKMRAGRAGVSLILLVPPKTPLWSHGKAGGRRGGGRQYGSFKTATGKSWRRGRGSGCQRLPARRGGSGAQGGPLPAPRILPAVPEPLRRGKGAPVSIPAPCRHPGVQRASQVSGQHLAEVGGFRFGAKDPKRRGGGGRQLGDTPS